MRRAYAGPRNAAICSICRACGSGLKQQGVQDARIAGCGAQALIAGDGISATLIPFLNWNAQCDLPRSSGLQECFVSEAVEESALVNQGEEAGEGEMAKRVEDLSKELQKEREGRKRDKEEHEREKCRLESQIDRCKEAVTREKYEAQRSLEAQRRLESEKERAEASARTAREELQAIDEAFNAREKDELTRLIDHEKARLREGSNPEILIEGLCRRVVSAQSNAESAHKDYWHLVKENKEIRQSAELAIIRSRSAPKQSPQSEPENFAPPRTNLNILQARDVDTSSPLDPPSLSSESGSKPDSLSQSGAVFIRSEADGRGGIKKAFHPPPPAASGRKRKAQKGIRSFFAT